MDPATRMRTQSSGRGQEPKQAPLEGDYPSNGKVSGPIYAVPALQALATRRLVLKIWLLFDITIIVSKAGRCLYAIRVYSI